jgi:hypothetical protein
MLLHKKPTPERSRFPIEQKRREPVREALLKETGLSNEVESPEQRGVLSVGRGVCYTTKFSTQLYQTGWNSERGE